MKIKDLLDEISGLDPNTDVKLVFLDSDGNETTVTRVYAELNDNDELELYGGE